MPKRLAYVDQNVVGLQLEGKVDLSTVEGLQWVYSKEHFAEIRRSQNPQKYLEVLAALHAHLLELVLENFKLTDRYILVEAGSPQEHFASYLEAIAEVPSDEGIFDALQAWLNGGADADEVRRIPERYSAQLTSISERLTPELRERLKGGMAVDLSAVIEQVLSQGNDTERTRAAFGGGKGRFGDVKGDGQLRQIWELVKEDCGSSTSDEFFRFAPVGGTGQESPCEYLGIVGCCAVLDLLGFKAERKVRRVDKIPNVRSDAGHIGMGAYCSVLISADRRLFERAQAIYEYRNIGTIPVLVKVAE